MSEPEPLRIVRRLTPNQDDPAAGRHPAIYELSDGNFAVVGDHVTAELDGKLPPDASRADYEEIVRLPRELFIQAKPNIPGPEAL
jgi:hypothetical protein